MHPDDRLDRVPDNSRATSARTRPREPSPAGRPIRGGRTARVPAYVARLRFSRLQADHAGAADPQADGRPSGYRASLAYQEYLEVHPDEFATLFNTILINVTSFFRDPAAWEVVRTRSCPASLAAKAPGEPIRAWSAGCATGEEAYTIAMLLAEELGLEQFRERVKIYATDVDEDALDTARHAAYTDRAGRGRPAGAAGAVLRDSGRRSTSSARTSAARSSSAGTT